MMDKNLLVIDNFLDNPDEVRQNALSLNFNKIEKNVPGARSKALEGNLKKEVEDKLKITFSCEEIKWDLESDSFCFQSCQEGTQTWTHLDNRSEDSAEWSAVLYLTPDAPLDAGTGIFENEDSDMNVAVGNVYNRLVAYRGKRLYHRSILPGFGYDLESSRLTLTLFFDIMEKNKTEYNFKKDKFTILRNAIDPKVNEFVYNYFLVKRQVAQTLFEHRYIPPFCEDWGSWEDEQVPNTYAHYADIAMETLLLQTQPKMEKITGLELFPTYSYARIYKKGDILKRHKDRFSCEVSTTAHLGGDPWTIFVEGLGIDLNPGDMLIYSGCDLEHWREPFEGEECAQVFLHYNNKASKDSEKNIFDRRKHIGLPSWFKGRL